MQPAISLRHEVSDRMALAPTAAVGAEPGSNSIALDGVRIAYDDEGRGPTVVCTHAIGHGAGDYAGFRARHRDHYRVIALDWPDQGRSSADSAPRAPATAPCRPARSTLDLERVVLLGNSIGGAAALRVAATPRSRAGGDRLQPRRPRRARTAEAGVHRGDRPVLARGARRSLDPARLRGDVPRHPQRATRRRAARAHRRHLAGDRAGARRAWRSFGQSDDDLTPLLPRIVCPVLITWSVGDRLNPLAFNRPGIAKLPNGELVTFTGGHSPFLECPEAFDQAFARFMEQRA